MSIRKWLGKTLGLTGSSAGFWSLWAGGENSSNEVVTPVTAMQIPAFNRGVRLTAETVSTLPFNTYERKSRSDAVLVDGGPYDEVLRISPNADETTVEYWEGMVGLIVARGNSFSLKQRIGGRLVGLDAPMSIDQCEPYRRQTDFALWYRGTDHAGGRFDVPASEIFHLKGFSFGGDLGMSPVECGVQSLGTVMAGNRIAASILANGMQMSGFVEGTGVINEEDRERYQKILDDFTGSRRTGKVFFLEGGQKFHQTSMSSADAQLLMQIHFGIEEIARWLGMPPVLLGHNPAGQTMWGTGVEAIIQSWYTLGLRALLKRIETAISKRIFEPADRQKFYVKINVDALLRGDSNAQALLFGAAAQNGWLTRNEIRRLIDYPPLPGGDDLTVQVNMTLLRQLESANDDERQQARLALRKLIGIDDDEAQPPIRKAA